MEPAREQQKEGSPGSARVEPVAKASGNLLQRQLVSVCVPVCRGARLCVYLCESFSLCVCISMWESVCLSRCVCGHVCTCLSMCLSGYLCVCVPVCLYTQVTL